MHKPQSNQYAFQRPLEVMAALDATGAVKGHDPQLGITTYALEDGSVVAVYGAGTFGHVRAFRSNDAFCSSVW